MTYIGNERCARCGGGSAPCPVCNPIEPEPNHPMKLAIAVVVGINATMWLLVIVLYQQA